MYYSTFLSVYLSVCLTVRPSVRLSIYLSVYLSVSLSVYLSIYKCLYSPLLGLARSFSFLIFYTVGRTPWMGDQPIVSSLPAYRTAQIYNKHTKTFMPQVVFEPTTPVFERAKTVHALDGSATVIGTALF
jgi:hypothetical protein